MKVLLVVMVLCQLLLSDAMASIQSRTADGPLKEKGDDSVGLSANNTELHQAYTRSRRSVSNYNTKNCYKQFFVGKNPPRGFKERFGTKYICQQFKVFSDSFYATMFDQGLGIPIYAGYIVPKRHKDFGTFSRVAKWSQDPDIERQGSNEMYQGSSKFNWGGIHKGHLVPAQTYSFDKLSIISTFRYTNAVPQYAAFNIGSWKAFENKVRMYADHCGENDGDLYLLTGISEVQLVNIKKWQFNNEKKLSRFPNNDKSSIAIPNSMWTAGCCVYGKYKSKVFGAFAAIGNNVDEKEPMQSVTVADLQDILKIGIGKKIVLFPGNNGCALPDKQKEIQVYKNTD